MKNKIIIGIVSLVFLIICTFNIFILRENINLKKQLSSDYSLEESHEYKTTQENSMSGFWVYQNDIIHIFDDSSFEWISFGSSKGDSKFGKYLYSYKTGRVNDYTLLFEKSYTLKPETTLEADNSVIHMKFQYYYTPDQIPSEAFKKATGSYVINKLTNNVFVLSDGAKMTNYNFTRQEGYTIKYDDKAPLVIQDDQVQPEDIIIKP